MISSKDLKGLMAMMPAFATDGANDIDATNTVSVERMEKGLDRMIRDGANVIAAAGSFGEFHTLLPDEFATLTHAASDITKQRVPLFVGATSLNSREVVSKLKIVSQTKADGVLLGVPFYFPSSPGNAIRFYREIAERFPKLAIMIYHNPPLHNIKLHLPVMEQILKIPTVIGMKDSHRDPLEFVKLCEMAKGKMSVFCNQWQYMAFAPLGAPGFWSIDAWMGPWPCLALRDAVARGDWAKAKEISLDLAPPYSGAAPNLSWRETASKIGAKYAGYVDPGPLRPPFLDVPPEVDEGQKRSAERWKKLCEKYRADVSVPA